MLCVSYEIQMYGFSMDAHNCPYIFLYQTERMTNYIIEHIQMLKYALKEKTTELAMNNIVTVT